MKITTSQLRKIIREAVEEELAKKEAEAMDEADLAGDTVEFEGPYGRTDSTMDSDSSEMLDSDAVEM